MSDGPKKSRTGRIIVYVVFWSLATWVLVAILGSVAYNLYGQPPVPGSSEATFARRQRTWCLQTLVGLRDELEVEVTHELAYPAPSRPPMARWNAWVDDWRAQLEDATARCAAGHDPDMSEGYQDLSKLYEGYKTGVSQISKSRQELARGLETVVQRLSQPR